MLRMHDLAGEVVLTGGVRPVPVVIVVVAAAYEQKRVVMVTGV